MCRLNEDGKLQLILKQEDDDAVVLEFATLEGIQAWLTYVHESAVLASYGVQGGTA